MIDQKPIRLDITVVENLGNISRATAAKLIEGGHVKVNSEVTTKASYKVNSTDKIAINYNFNSKVAAIELPVIYEDKDVVVIDKPIGLLSHSKGAYNPETTVATWLSDRYDGPKSERAGIVHRLDRATSGVMIAGKNEAAAKWLQKQFALRKVKKTYIAIVSGHLNHIKAIIDLPIERNPKTPQFFRVGAAGKQAETEYEVIDSNDSYSLLVLKPATGRTHQLRVHLAHLGHPIVGDTLYKGKSADRLYLHAKELEITLPDKSRQTFVSKLPKEFKLFMSHA